MTEPLVSVVINTYNRRQSIPNTLAGLRGLRYSEFEIIVVNGPSTDGTSEFLEKWSSNIKRVDCSEANLAASRNAGIAASSGQIIAFIDDDAVPHPNWLAELARPYLDPRVGGVGGFTVDNTGARYQVRKTIC